MAVRLASASTPPPESRQSIASGTAEPMRWSASVFRETLTQAESAAEMRIAVSLRLRNVPELRARVAAGEILSHAELDAKYLPLTADYQSVRNWLEREGIAPASVDSYRTVIIANAPAVRVARAFKAPLVRLVTAEGEFTSSLSTPSLPTAEGLPLAEILSVDGLQPHLRAKTLSVRSQTPLLSLFHAVPNNPGFIAPDDIAAAYNVPTNVDGARETIAIIVDAVPQITDLSQFWAICGTKRNQAAYTVVPVNGGPADKSPNNANAVEATLDVAWAGAVAPGAALRLYTPPSLASADIYAACVRILNDQLEDESIRQVSLSFGNPETLWGDATLQASSQLYLLLASRGITVVVASGDGGSNPSTDGTNAYHPGNQANVSYPASDPNVLAVGGTVVRLNQDGMLASETGWPLSGGGVSRVFARPSWQTIGSVTGAPTMPEPMRYVPDVAAVAAATGTRQGDGVTQAESTFVIFNGTAQSLGGTSLSAPVWAGFCALINQSLRNAGRLPLGLAGRRLYPLAQSGAFVDITSGSNGLFTASTGFDLCTGLGRPNVTALASQLGSAALPVITKQPAPVSVVAGSPFTLSIGVSAEDCLIQWYQDGVAVPDANAATFTVERAAQADSGSYTAKVRNYAGEVTTEAARVTVAPDPAHKTPTALAITTLAGVSPGFADGAGTLARFREPLGIAADRLGNIYVADSANHVVRKITPDGAVTTIAGTPGQPDYIDADRQKARLGFVRGIVVDPDFNVYIADWNTVRKIAPDGQVSTLPGLTGAFRSTDSLALDRAGNLYVVDNQSCTVSRIAPDGTVAVIAGQAGQRGSMDGVGAAARFDSPSSVSAEADGTLYVADRSNCTIRKITPSGIVTTLAGLAGSAGLANGQGADARFWYAAGVAADGQGRVYVADSGADRIRVIAADGTVSYVAGAVLSKGYSMSGSVDGTGPNALFNHPTNLVVAPSGDIFVADTGNATIRKVTAAGVVTTFAGRASMGTADGAGADAQFQHPRGLALDAAGNAYVADQQSNTIRQITPAGVVSTFAGVADGSVAAFDGPRQMARFYWPAGVAVDRGGHVYVADTMNNLIRIIDRDGWVSTLAGKAFALAKPGSANEGIGGLNPGGSADGVGAEAEFYGPTGIAVDRAGFVYVADQGNHTIRRISPEGKVTTLAGLARTHGSADGVGAAARFNWPSGVAVDAHGNVFVADTMNNAIRKITPDGIVSTIAGKVGLWGGDGSPTTAWGSADGGGGRARFNTPAGVAVDDYGNLYVADRGNSLLRLIQPSGVVTTLAGYAGFNGLGAGESGSSGSVDALGVAARLNLPTGIAVTQSGTVYFTDSGNRTVRVGAPATPPRLAPVIAELIASEANPIGSRADLSVNVIGTPAPSIQWHHNGTALIPGNQPQLSLPGFQPSNAGIYTAVATNAAGTIDSGPSIVGVSTTDKVAGSGTVLGTDIRHPNGRRFDQVLLTGVAEAITASPGHVTRTAFIDDNDDIVQVEFSGPGTLSLVLANAFAPATPVNYTQPIKYMKGHAGIVITGATGQTHVSVFTVGRATAVDPTGAFDILQSPGPDNDPARNGSSLFEGRSQTRYDGKADIAFIAISSADGHFGGIRTSNAFYSASRGITGVYAPGVVIDGPLFIGNIRGSGSATAMIVVGSVQDARITGGDLLQTNNMPVQVEGLTTLRSTAGGDSHGNVLPARPIVGLLATGKRSVNDLLVVNP